MEGVAGGVEWVGGIEGCGRGWGVVKWGQGVCGRGRGGVKGIGSVWKGLGGCREVWRRLGGVWKGLRGLEGVE